MKKFVVPCLNVLVVLALAAAVCVTTGIFPNQKSSDSSGAVIGNVHSPGASQPAGQNVQNGDSSVDEWSNQRTDGGEKTETPSEIYGQGSDDSGNAFIRPWAP